MDGLSTDLESRLGPGTMAALLKLDRETRDIPLVTFTIEDQSEPELQNRRMAGLQEVIAES